jgi:hypothetical protein
VGVGGSSPLGRTNLLDSLRMSSKSLLSRTLSRLEVAYAVFLDISG